jgi:nucleotidyltransferase substrate binding protein (TIGR01987 family)
MSKLKNKVDNYKKSLAKLQDIINKYEFDKLDEYQRDSLIKRFELTFELSWNVLKEYLEFQGETELYGSRNTFKIAFQRGIISSGDIWLKMIESRVLSAHSYDESNAYEIATRIYNDYIDLFNNLLKTIDKFELE